MKGPRAELQPPGAVQTMKLLEARAVDRLQVLIGRRVRRGHNGDAGAVRIVGSR
jgi:hypothetical protein